MADPDPYAPVRALLIVIQKDPPQVSLRQAASAMKRNGTRTLAHGTIGKRLSGESSFADVGEVDALAQAFGADGKRRDEIRKLYGKCSRDASPSATDQSSGQQGDGGRDVNDDRRPTAGKDRSAIRALLASSLPSTQFAAGNGDMLAEVATDELQPGELLVCLYPCRSTRSMGGSAVLLVTDRAVILVELVGNGVAGRRRRRAISEVARVPLEPHRALHLRKATLTICWQDGDEWSCRGLRREQAQDVADLLRPQTTR